MRAWWRLLALGLALWAGAASAHEMSMAELNVREVARGDFLLTWSAGEKNQPAESLKPEWPAHCKQQENLLRCGAEGLNGTLTVHGVGQRFSVALVKLHWLDGPLRVYTLTGSQPSVRLFGAAEDGRSGWDVAGAYTLLGVEHILSGWDHLLFVVGLLFLVGFRQRLVWTITAFTAAHSVTLALGALGWLTLNSAPVEACIALSILLVAGEALRARETLSKRLPALVAFVFGLVHGLGFAGALAEFGLPQQHLAVALGCFNLGVEAGQLLVVGAAFALTRLALRWPAMLRARVPALYAVGSLAAYWTIARAATLAG